MFYPQYEKCLVITVHIHAIFTGVIFERNFHGVGMLMNINENFLYIQLSSQRDSSWLKVLPINNVK